MKRNQIKGDLLHLFSKGNFDAIVHGCNCFCLMGAGIAHQISQNYPSIREVDISSNRGDMSKLGSYSFAEYEEGTIVNGYTQYYPGANFEYKAFQELLGKLNEKFKGKHLGFPQIGCGIGGGNWEDVQTMIHEYLPDVDVTIVYYDNGQKRMGQGEIDFVSDTEG